MLRLNTDNMCMLDELSAKVKALLAAVDVTEARIRGPYKGKCYSIKFEGDELTAGRRARKLLESLKGPNGWNKVFFARSDTEQVQVFIGPDKDPNTIKREKVARMLRNFFKDKAMGDHRFETIGERSSSVIVDGWDELCWISINAMGKVNVRFSDQGMAKIGVSKEEADTHWKEKAVSPLRG